MAECPIPLETFQRLPDDYLLRVREICSTPEKRGPWPFGRSQFFQATYRGEVSGGRIYGKQKFWTAGEIRAALAKIAAGDTQHGRAA